MDAKAESQRTAGPSVPVLDPGSGTLQCGGTVATLRPKTLAVLVLLMERRGAVVSPDVLRGAVWGRRHGNDNGPKQCIRELRKILGDDSIPRRFIETVGLYGYRYLGGIEMVGEHARRDRSSHGARRNVETAPFVGRENELNRLSTITLDTASGQGAVVLITGEAGAGKTALVDAFLSRHEAAGDSWIARAQCAPNQGPREPYGPLLELISRLSEAPVGRVLTKIIRDRAPTLFAQLPNVFGARETGRRDAQPTGIAPTRLLRELVEVFYSLDRHRPGMLVIEDIHWADTSTLAWISACASQREAGRLIVICTCRSDELVGDNRAVMETVHELRRSPAFHEVKLAGLGADAIRAYLESRFPVHAFPPSLAPQLAQRTEGHALFVASLVETWLAEGLLREESGKWAIAGSTAELMRTIPARANEVIDFQISKLTQIELDILTAGSIAGSEFAVATISGGAFDEETIEQQCENLARRRLFVQRSGVSSWPDGTVTANYIFTHALYHEAIYSHTPPVIRQKWHQRIGDRLETAYRDRVVEIAALLATHFERAGDIPRAVTNHQQAAETALKRGAARESVSRLRHALDLLQTEPDGEARKREELRLQTQLGAALMIAEGFASPSVVAAYGRAQDISLELADSVALLPTLYGLWNYHLTRADFSLAQPLAGRLYALARQAETDRVDAFFAHNVVGTTHWLTGRLPEAEPHIDAVVSSYDIERDSDNAASFGEDPGVVGNMYGAIVHQLRADSHAAEQHVTRGMKIATSLEHPFGMAQMLWAGALVARERADIKLTLQRARQLIRCCRDNEVEFWLSGGFIFEGWASVAASGTASGITRIREGIERWCRDGTRLTLPLAFAILADACLRLGRQEEAREALDCALGHVHRSGECWYKAEIHRLSGLVEIGQGGRAASERAASEIGLAIRTAQDQGARLLEVRAMATFRDSAKSVASYVTRRGAQGGEAI
ncbi:ATP-binding protein [Chelatococcus sp. GCM10030263]|uniref:ATP-binding protein n=1 Tax=Chelatococcus sp. GCM10030263 TaxID=3273387 RepID=UPI00360ACE44